MRPSTWLLAAALVLMTSGMVLMLRVDRHWVKLSDEELAARGPRDSHAGDHGFTPRGRLFYGVGLALIVAGIALGVAGIVVG